MSYVAAIGAPKPYSLLGVIKLSGKPDPKMPSFATKAEAESWGQKQVAQMNAKEKA